MVYILILSVSGEIAERFIHHLNILAKDSMIVVRELVIDVRSFHRRFAIVRHKPYQQRSIKSHEP